MHSEISSFLQQRIDAGDFPSAVYLVAEKGEIVFHDALGFAVVEPKRIPARLDTIYDLASLTKPLVTGLLCAKLIETREIDLNTTATDYLPELADVDENAGRPEIVEYDCLDVLVEELLTHHSGYQAWKPFYLLVDSADANVRAAILYAIANRIPPLMEPEVIYSDLNFIMLAAILERLRAKLLNAIASTEILGPLGLTDTFFNPPKELLSRIAANENGNEYERQTCIELGYLQVDAVAHTDLAPTFRSGTGGNPVATAPGSDMFRNYQIWGEVHDGNAWFMGGVAGHAGLFSTAEEVFKIAQQFLSNHSTLLKPETCQLFRTNFTQGMNEARSIAFQLAETPGSTAGTKMSPQSFGHNGFTGTSLWIDPIEDRIFILLTNRTHNHPLPFVNINIVRRRFHDRAIELLDKKA